MHSTRLSKKAWSMQYFVFSFLFTPFPMPFNVAAKMYPFHVKEFDGAAITSEHKEMTYR